MENDGNVTCMDLYVTKNGYNEQAVMFSLEVGSNTSTSAIRGMIIIYIILFLKKQMFTIV